MDNSQQPIVTMLVAIYNAEGTLAKALDSLLAQTYRALQVVCIDDASTDRSLSVLHEYARRDPRIMVIALSHNNGQAHARNVGLKYARGKWIGFLDSDDWLSPDAIEQVVATFQSYPRTGAVLFDLMMSYPDGHEQPYAMDPFIVMSGYDAFMESLTWRIHGVYVARADLYRQFPYDESCKFYSDDNTTRQHYLHADEVRTCSGEYHYLQHDGSATHAFSLRRFDYLKANMSMKRQLEQLGVGEEVLDVYENHRWLNVIDMYMIYHRNGRQLSHDEAHKALAAIREAWESIEVRRVRPGLKFKFGYAPMRPPMETMERQVLEQGRCESGKGEGWCFLYWRLFRMEEELYFFLRALKD